MRRPVDVRVCVRERLVERFSKGVFFNGASPSSSGASSTTNRPHVNNTETWKGHNRIARKGRMAHGRELGALGCEETEHAQDRGCRDDDARGETMEFSYESDMRRRKQWMSWRERGRRGRES